MATSYDKQVRFFFRKNSGIGIAKINLYGEQMLDRAVAADSFIELQSSCLIDDAKNILQN
jgi:hypothetical protein